MKPIPKVRSMAKEIISNGNREANRQQPDCLRNFKEGFSVPSMGLHRVTRFKDGRLILNARSAEKEKGLSDGSLPG